MNNYKLFESLGYIDDKILLKSEKKSKLTLLKITAAVLAIAFLFNFSPAYAVKEAVYPEIAPYPSNNPFTYNETMDKWDNCRKERLKKYYYTVNVDEFLSNSLKEFLSNNNNSVYSPVNTYISLAMLAETTSGNTREQILNLLNEKDITSLRENANKIWNSHYNDDKLTKTILANSIWFDNNISFNSDTLEILAENYYTSSYQGKMGSNSFNKAYKKWLKSYSVDAQDSLTSQTVFAIASAIEFDARWLNEFTQTEQGVFHSNDNDINCEFMKSESVLNYYWGDTFSAVRLNLQNQIGSMFFILPDKDMKTDEISQFILSNYNWSNTKELKVNLSLPKFEIKSSLDLVNSFKNMGITDIFDENKADFSPLTSKDTLFITDVIQNINFKIDEEGVSASGYTRPDMTGGVEPVSDEIDFILNRPFLFVITNRNKIPLFIGSVYNP